jgi:hypothetical protein
MGPLCFEKLKLSTVIAPPSFDLSPDPTGERNTWALYARVIHSLAFEKLPLRRRATLLITML